VSDDDDGAGNPEIDEVQVLEAALSASEGFLASSSQDMRLFIIKTIRAAIPHHLHQPPTSTLI